MYVIFSDSCSAVQPSHAAGDDSLLGEDCQGGERGRIPPANRDAALDLYIHANFSLPPCQSGTRTLERTCISLPTGPIHLCRLVLYGVNGSVDQVKEASPSGPSASIDWKRWREKVLEQFSTRKHSLPSRIAEWTETAFETHRKNSFYVPCLLPIR